jgi:hypothetical protein
MLAFGRECLATGRFDRVPAQFERIPDDIVDETGGWRVC